MRWLTANRLKNALKVLENRFCKLKYRLYIFTKKRKHYHNPHITCVLTSTIFLYQGRVARKLVNVNPGLNVN